MRLNDLQNLKDKAQVGLGKAKNLSDAITSQPAVNKVITTAQTSAKTGATMVQTGLSKAKDNPTIGKISDSLDGMSGKRLEEKLSEYTDVYGDVLLALHSRMEEAEKQQRLMMDEIQSLCTTVSELLRDLERTRNAR